MATPHLDLLLRNGLLYGGAGAAARPGDVAVAGGVIVCAGPGCAAEATSAAATIDLAGRVVLPGFHDAHIHPLIGGRNRLECPLAGLADRDRYLAAIAAHARRHPELTALRGNGWLYSAFGGTAPRKEELDRIEPRRPVAIVAADGHCAWVNSRALALAGIDAATPDPPGGRIERDPQSGEPTGLLLEWSAMQRVTDRLPPPTAAELAAGGRLFLAEAARRGITSVGEAMATAPLLAAYARLEEAGELTVRVRAALLAEPHRRHELERLAELRRRFASRLLRPEAVKLFLDGVVEARTAHLLAPYADRPGDRGIALWPREEWHRLAIAADRAGLQLHLHAIGDGAVRSGLDGIAAARAANGPRDARHQLAHLELVDPADLPRFRRLGAIANLQPAWLYRDSDYRDTVLPALGAARARCLFPLRELLDAGAALACGSDWPFGGDQVSCDPLEAIQVGATRRPPRAGADHPPLPGGPAGVAELLHAYTAGGAWAMFQERETGAVAAGMAADLAVLEGNPFETPEELGKARVVLTLFDGRVVYRDPAW